MSMRNSQRPISPLRQRMIIGLTVVGSSVVRTLMGSSSSLDRVFDNTILRDRTLPSPLGTTAIAVQFNLFAADGSGQGAGKILAP